MIRSLQPAPVMCEAKSKPSRWDREIGPHSCVFRATTVVKGRKLCGTHARIANRPGPVFTEVLAFIVKQRDGKTALWKEIVQQYQKGKA